MSIVPKQNRFCTLAGADLSRDEVEFANAVNEWKRKNKKAFPLCSELLAIARSLGYRKVADAQPTPRKKKPA